MAVGEIISAARYNSLQAKVANVLGNGAGDFGYGQDLTSNQMTSTTGLTITSDTDTTIVRATHMQKLKTDITTAYFHQNNSAPTLTDVVADTDITDAVYIQYSAVVDDVYTNRLDYDINQVTGPEFKKDSQRTTVWGGSGEPQTIIHEVDIEFNNADHLRHFFNSGGEIRHNTTFTNGTGTKYTEWRSMATTLGVLVLNYLNTTASSGSSYGLGVYDLTTTYQTIFTKTGSGVYSDNLITYKARIVDKTLTIRVEYYDGEPAVGGVLGIDEQVTGIITSIFEQQRSTGSVVVSTPAYYNRKELNA